MIQWCFILDSMIHGCEFCHAAFSASQECVQCTESCCVSFLYLWLRQLANDKRINIKGKHQKTGVVLLFFICITNRSSTVVEGQVALLAPILLCALCAFCVFGAFCVFSAFCENLNSYGRTFWYPKNSCRECGCVKPFSRLRKNAVCTKQA